MQTRAGRLAIAAGLTVAASLGLAAGAAAATIEVDTPADENLDPGPETGCSLREATVAANTDTAFGGCPAGEPSDTITFDPAVFPVGAPAETIDLDGVDGELVLTSNTEVVGPGSAELVITNMNDTDRIFLTDEGVGDTILISGLTISSGHQEGTGNPAEGSWRGGGILNHAHLTLADVKLTGNAVSAHGDELLATEAGAEGGGIYTDDDLTIDSSVIELNQVDADNADSGVFDVWARGAGIFHADGGVTVTNSRIEANSAAVDDQSTDTVGIDEAAGGGIFAENEAVISQTTINSNGLSATGMTGDVSTKGAGIRIDGGDGSRIELSTIAGNSAVGSGAGGTERRGAGILVIGSPMPVVSSTIAKNGHVSTETNGANLFKEGPGDVTVTNSIVAEPVGLTEAGTTNCDDSQVVSGGFNVDYEPGAVSSDCHFTEPTDTTDDPLLGPLADNGGFGLTILPETGSPVIDKGSATEQDVADQDQRGFDRPAFFDTISDAPTGDGSDIGAVEVQIAPPIFIATSPVSPNIDETPNVLGSVPAADGADPLVVRLFTNPSCTVATGAPSTPGVFASPGIASGPFAPATTTTFYGMVESDYGDSHCSTGPFPNTIAYTVPRPPQPPPLVTPPPAGTTPAPPRKKCKKGFVRKRGKCVRKKRKKGAK
jgi:hypothetical protein